MHFKLAAAVAATVLSLGAAESLPPANAATTLGPLVTYGDWLGARPSSAALRGRVVVVDIFTFGCFNCKNVTPNLQSLYRRHDQKLAIVGVHTPETPYESDRKNVVANLAAQGIVWPVAIDNGHALWNAYHTEYWPTQLIFDKHGTLRKTVVGDSQDAVVDATVAQLLAEN